MKEAPRKDDPQDVEKVLSDEILSDAKASAESSVHVAGQDCEKLLEKAVHEAQASRDEALRQALAGIERERMVSESSLRLEERMRRLKTQGELIEEVFAAVDARLAARTWNVRAVVTNLVVEAVRAMEGDAFVVHLAKTDLDALKNVLPGAVAAAGLAARVTVSDTPAPIEGGVIVETADGRERVDNSFAARLARVKDEMRFDVAEILFPEKEPTG